jgi:hypothetical protein
MKTTLQLVKNFEKRNNISVAINFYSDGSGEIRDFWDDEVLESFDSADHLHNVLKSTQYELAEDGICLFPVRKV